jgi:hypothetical protein
MDYKFVELLSCDFLMSTEEDVRRSIAYRFNLVKSKLAMTQARIQDISSVLKVKNPSLLAQI